MFALVDCNNFFVSCERVFDPTLAGQPVAVLSNNDGCVISRSNELKALGVKMGMPYFQLKPLIDRCHILIRSGNYELYGDLSRRVMTVLADFAPDVEQYSIDEAFLVLSLPSGGDYLDYAGRIRQTILQWIGIPVSVGIAPTKTLAKVAGHLAKSSAAGMMVLPEDTTTWLTALPVGEVWSVGRHLTEKLERLGLRTARQLRDADEGMLRQKFSVSVARTALELRGVPTLEPGDIGEPSQSITCSRSFGHPVIELKDLAEAVATT